MTAGTRWSPPIFVDEETPTASFSGQETSSGSSQVDNFSVGPADPVTAAALSPDDADSISSRESGRRVSAPIEGTVLCSNDKARPNTTQCGPNSQSDPEGQGDPEGQVGPEGQIYPKGQGGQEVQSGSEGQGGPDGQGGPEGWGKNLAEDKMKTEDVSTEPLSQELIESNTDHVRDDGEMTRPLLNEVADSFDEIDLGTIMASFTSDLSSKVMFETPVRVSTLRHEMGGTVFAGGVANTTTIPLRSTEMDTAAEDEDGVTVLLTGVNKHASRLVPASRALEAAAASSRLDFHSQIHTDDKTPSCKNECSESGNPVVEGGQQTLKQPADDGVKSVQELSPVAILPLAEGTAVLSAPLPELPESTCDICTKGFAASSELSDHKRSAHLVDNISDEETPESISGEVLNKPSYGLVWRCALLPL
jgi:hypothetical protein